MQIYLLQDGEKRGPFSVFEVAEEVRSDRADEDTLGWHQGSDGWIRLEDLPAASSIFVEPPPRPAEQREQTMAERRAQLAPERMRSSIRLWARLLDLFLLSMVVLSGVIGSGWMTATELFSRPHLEVKLMPAALLMVLEAFSISACGWTPGKWLFRVRVVADAGGKIPLSISFYRSLTVWWRGVGFWLVPLNIIMMALAQASLLSTGKTPWDRACALDVTFGKLDRNRIFLILGVVALALLVVGTVFHEQLAEAGKVMERKP